jgi:hypothetical protein
MPFFAIPFVLNFLHESLVILWHNEFPNLRVCMENKIRTITLNRVFEGKHDLYLLFVGEKSETLFVVVCMEFRKP